MAHPQRLDTDRYYDGGCIEGEPTEKQYREAERQAAADRQSEELNEVLICITQARGGIKIAAKDGRTVEIQPLVKEIVVSARALIQEAYNHLYVANMQSLPSDDQIIMEHVRHAQMLTKLALDATKEAA